MRNKIIFVLLLTLALFAVCFFALKPLFIQGFFTMHDDEQIGRLYEMIKVLGQGQFPPRWVPDLGFGFGYPLFNFYPPLVYYVGFVFHFFGLSLINSTKLVMGLGFFFAAGGMFAWVRKHYGILAGFFAAILYTYAPYHSVDVYVRGALAEFFSWIWIPLIFWSVDKLFENNEKKYIIILGLFFALLMLSHTLVMLQFGPLFLLYVGFAFFRNRNNMAKKALYLSLAVSLGLGLTAYFWIPSLFEKQYTLVDAVLTKELANYAIHFVCPIQLWSGVWGYGGSGPGCLDGLSFQVGKIQAFVAGLGILISIFFLFKKRILASTVMCVLFLCSIFMTLPYSKFIWDTVKPFWYIQFPWRYLLFVAVGSAFLGGFILFQIEKWFGRYVAIGVFLILSFLCIYQVRNDFHPQTYLSVLDKYYTDGTAITWHVSGLSYEYVPEKVATRVSSIGTTELAISESDLQKKPYAVKKGNMTVNVLENISYLKKLSVNVYNEGILQINTFNFPGWSVFVDGRQVTNSIPNRLDLIQFSLGKGMHEITVEFKNTFVREIANDISLVSFIVLALVLIFHKKINL